MHRVLPWWRFPPVYDERRDDPNSTYNAVRSVFGSATARAHREITRRMMDCGRRRSYIRYLWRLLSGAFRMLLWDLGVRR